MTDDVQSTETGSDDISLFMPVDTRLFDQSRQAHVTPCPDCGRVHLNGEHVTWTVPTVEGGLRTVWSGCCDCWVRRSSPTTEHLSDAEDDALSDWWQSDYPDQLCLSDLAAVVVRIKNGDYPPGSGGA